MAAYKPVGVNEDSLFPPRVMAELDERYARISEQDTLTSGLVDTSLSETRRSIEDLISLRIQGLYPPAGSAKPLADWQALYEADNLPLGDISSWGDSSGNGHTLTPNQLAVPKVQTWHNEKAVYFDASPLESLSFAPIAWPLTIIMVVQSNVFPGWFFGGDEARINRASGAVTPAGEFRMSSRNPPSTSVLASGVVSNLPRFVAAVFDGASSRFHIDSEVINGALDTSDVPDGLSNIRLGGWLLPDHYLTGHIAMCGVVGKAMTISEINTLRGWAQTKFGLL